RQPDQRGQFVGQVGVHALLLGLRSQESFTAQDSEHDRGEELKGIRGGIPGLPGQMPAGAQASTNLPGALLRKRAWSFLVWISRVKAAYNVAEGVLPAGLVQ